MIHMKNQNYFSLQNKKKLKCRLLQFLLGAFRVNSRPALILNGLNSKILLYLQNVFPLRFTSSEGRQIFLRQTNYSWKV